MLTNKLIKKKKSLLFISIMENKINITMLGTSFSGKTSLITRFTRETFFEGSKNFVVFFSI